MWGAIIGGAISLLSKRRAEKRQDSSISRTLADAKKNGIHALTALRSGAVSSFSGPSALASTAGFAADAVNAFFDAPFQKSEREHAAKIEALELETMELQLANLKGDLDTNRSFGYSIPRAVNNTGIDHETNYPNLYSGSPANSDGRFFGRPDGVHRNVDHVKIGVDLPTNPHFSDAQVIEDRHGDLASNVYGVATLSADAVAAGVHYGGKALDALSSWYGGIQWPTLPSPTPKIDNRSRRSRRNRSQ